jgi:hypothetical protein
MAHLGYVNYTRSGARARQYSKLYVSGARDTAGLRGADERRGVEGGQHHLRAAHEREGEQGQIVHRMERGGCMETQVKTLVSYLVVKTLDLVVEVVHRMERGLHAPRRKLKP